MDRLSGCYGCIPRQDTLLLHNLSPSVDVKGCTEIVWKCEKMLGEVTFDGSVSHPEKALMLLVALH